MVSHFSLDLYYCSPLVSGIPLHIMAQEAGIHPAEVFFVPPL